MRRQRESLPVLSVTFRIDSRESWFYYALNLVLSRRGHRRSTAHTIVCHSRCVMWYLGSALVSNLDQYQIGLTVLSGCFWRQKQLTRTSQVSVLGAKWPVELCRPNISGDMNAFFSDFMDWSSSSINVLNVEASSFLRFLIKFAASLAKLVTKRLKTSPNPRNEQSSVRFHEALCPCIAFVVCDAIWRHPKRMLCSR